MNVNSFNRKWAALCPPAAFFPVLMAAVILFDMYMGKFKRLLSHVAITIVGTLLLYLLCVAKLEIVAYALYIIPLIFFIFFLAVLVYDRARSGKAITDIYVDECGNEYCEENKESSCCRR